jgi:two-component system, sensor histidine kinase and response regulator
LMDLQMPEMDGHQATARIRSDPRFASLPILAMTAHATIEERQRCLASGMNDHISKPIDPALLFATVGRFYKPGAAAAPSDKGKEAGLGNAQEMPSVAKSPGLPTFEGLDTKDGLARVAGNQKLYLKLLRQFAEQQGPSVEQITTALAQADTALAERLAHTLKGVAGNIGAKLVQAAAGALEKLIRDRAAAAKIDPAKQKVAAALDPLLAQLRSALNSPVPEAPASAATPLAANPAQSREAAERLAKLLAEFDPGAADFIEANQASLRSLFKGDTWSQFEKLVQNYAFAEAQAQLAEALKTL